MTFTTPELLLLMGGFFSGVVMVINAFKNRRIEDGLARVQSTTAVIEGHVNSAATAARSALEAGAAREIATAKEREILIATISDLRKTAELLAQQAGPTKGT